MATSTIPKLEHGVTVQTQLALPSSVTIASGSNGTLLSGVSPSSLTYNALDKVPSSGTLKWAMFLWATGGVFVPTDILVQSGLLTIKGWNVSSNSITITAVRLLLHYE